MPEFCKYVMLELLNIELFFVLLLFKILHFSHLDPEVRWMAKILILFGRLSCLIG